MKRPSTVPGFPVTISRIISMYSENYKIKRKPLEECLKQYPESHTGLAHQAHVLP